MPLHLEPLDVSVDLENYKSVLIVTCPICPPVSLATEKDSPFIEFFKSGIKTRAYEDFIQAIREPLEQRGVQTGALTIYAPCPAMCLWTKGQRNRLLKRARDYEAVLVMGCESARYIQWKKLSKHRLQSHTGDAAYWNYKCSCEVSVSLDGQARRFSSSKCERGSRRRII